MAQSKAKFNKIPEIDFKLSSTGINIVCPRLYTPRYIPFDIIGRCEICKSDSAEIDFLITIDGITIYCSRLLQPKFVLYDNKYEYFPNFCLFRVKTKGKVFNVQHYDKSIKSKEQGIIENINNYDLDEEKEIPNSNQKETKSIEYMPIYLFFSFILIMMYLDFLQINI